MDIVFRVEGYGKDVFAIQGDENPLSFFFTLKIDKKINKMKKNNKKNKKIIGCMN